METSTGKLKRLLVGIALCGVSALMLAGSSFAGASRLQQVTVSYGQVPIAGAMAVAVAEKEGYFKAVGLDVSIENASAINTIVPGVVGGTYNFGFQSGGGTAAALSHNLPVAIIANAYYHNREQELMVKTGGPIKTLEDLVGKTVALGSLNNNYEAGLFYLLKKAGVDPSSVTFETMDTSQIAAAVEKGQVAAGQINEPFITTAGKQLTTLVDPLLAFGKHAANAYVIVNTHWADAHKDIVKKFLQAYSRGERVAETNRKLVNETIASFTNIDPKLIAKMNMPGFGPALHVASELQQQKLMYEYHFLAKPIGKEIFYKGVNIAAYAK